MLHRYERLKSDLAALGQAGMQLCRELNDKEGEHLYQALLARIAEDGFNLAVLGAFNRGKSTLMNALLGMERLPTGVLPHTSVITTVNYGAHERVLIRCEGWPLAEEVPLQKLAEYVTERGNPGNRRQVVSAEIQLPAEILRLGFHFIDMPGVGSGIAANTSTTERFLPEIDAAIVVSSVESPIGQDELRFLKQVHGQIGKVFVVINKIDLAPPKDRDEIMRFARRRLDVELGASSYGLFALSAKQALEAKLHGDTQALARSGLPELERVIANFLTTDKVNQLCSRTLDRLVSLLKRQQLELAIALATSEPNDPGTELRERFEREVSALCANAASTASSLRVKVSCEIAKQMHTTLHHVLRQLAERVQRKFAPQLASRKVLLHRSESTRVLKNTAMFCQQSISEWLATAGQFMIQPAIEKLGGRTLSELRRSPDAIPDLIADLAEFQIVPAEIMPSDHEDEAGQCELALPSLSHTKWMTQPSLWLALAPFHWRNILAYKWFSASCDAAMGEYRRQLENAISASAGEYIDRIARGVQRRIGETGKRIAGYIGSKQWSNEAASIEDLLQRATRLRQQIERGHSGAGGEPDALESSQKLEADFEADTALDEELCPVCRRAADVLFAFLSKQQYTISASEAAQALHATSGGFCTLHTWMYSEMTSPQGICRAYPALLQLLSERLLERLSSDCGTDDLEVALRRILRQAENCPACRLVAAVEKEEARNIVSSCSAMANGSTGLPVLCLAHLHTVLAVRPADALARALTRRTAKALDRSAENMRRYTLKNDAIRRNLMTHQERIAYFLGLTRVARDKRLAPRWANDEM